MEEFTEKVKQFFSEFGEGKPMVLSTTDNERVFEIIATYNEIYSFIEYKPQ